MGSVRLDGSSNKSFSEDILFEELMDFVQSTRPGIYLFEFKKKCRYSNEIDVHVHSRINRDQVMAH